MKGPNTIASAHDAADAVSSQQAMGDPQTPLDTRTGMQAPVSTAPELETPYLDVLLLLARAKTRILTIAIVGLVLGFVAALVIKPTFTAVATILPPQSPQSSLSSLMGQLGTLSGLGGSSSSLTKNPSDLYVGILQSRTLTDTILDQFQLQTLWKIKFRDDARKHLHAMASFESTKDGMIQITVKDKDPRSASAIANAYVDALYQMNSHLAISEASQRRLFFERQLDIEKAALEKAENELKDTQQKTGLITLSGQAELAIRNIAQTRAQISSKEVELQGLRAYASDENPDTVQLQRELGALRSELTAQENNQAKLAPGDTQVAASQMPAGGLEYARKMRDVRYHETLLELLSRQYEAARIDEGKAAPLVQVVDRAIPPDKKSGPSRLLLVFGAGFAALLSACTQVLGRHALANARREPQIAKKLDQLMGHAS